MCWHVPGFKILLCPCNQRTYIWVYVSVPKGINYVLELILAVFYNFCWSVCGLTYECIL